jgi:hypothetical protein
MFLTPKRLNYLANELRFSKKREYLLMLKALTHYVEANYFENLSYRYFNCLVNAKLTKLNCKAMNEVGDDVMVSIIETNTSDSSTGKRDLK